MDMEDMQDDAGPSEERSPRAAWWPSDFVEKFGSVSLDSKDSKPRNKELNDKEKYDRPSSITASQILWRTGMLSEPIPNGFYSVVPDKKLKELYEDIPTLEELHALETEGLRADVILVDTEKDKKLSMLKQLIVALVKGLNTNHAAMIKKIAGLMLGQIKHGSCRPRAILFKVLADTVGLESRLVVGLPMEGASECVDSYKHMSVLVVLNSVELLVDLMRFPGQLIPRSSKAIFMTHISAAGESDSAENDSCDSPLEPNSPLYGVSERVDPERGLMCIHRMKIIHRDLKSANCLVNKHWTVKICDFGLSRIMTNSPIKDSSSAGTPEWMAPELIRNEPFTEKCDIFSLGVIMWELYTLNRPWDGVPPERVVYAVANEGSRLEIPEGPVGRLIADCWAEPQDRPSCEEILTRLLDCELALC
ncbi:UNVERIFIED_CONTAM: Serine/threonine-protein kinase EDR1 [Sesamum latifolium]|uniref:Serine/threonine-protein kinase EDR1 n=1 Tax=Sesamum latifolium TaxID=2727402 RepID=A0AAW2WQY3_9LAMI